MLIANPITPFFTGSLESYHNERLKYLPKRTHFPYEGMVTRGILAILDHNANVGRDCLSESLKYSKGQKKWILKKKYETKSTGWRDALIDKIMRLESYDVEADVSDNIPQNIAPIPKPSIEEVRQQPRYSRFEEA
jgi:hypothetical protein